jgi:holo-[acyl-carrier protein] synthase
VIHGIGTDIVAVARLESFFARHGEKGLEKVLAPAEQAEFFCQPPAGRGRFLAKRWAAKEAFGKALGTGIRPPARLTAIAVAHDAAGRPRLEFSDALRARLAALHLVAHLSLSDEREFAIAHVILERP